MAEERGVLAREGKDGAAASSWAPDEFPPHVLREYSLLADGERGVLVGPKGDFSWMCAPRWDSDAVFSSLVGGAGMYAVTPTDRRTVWGGYYEEGSLIWRSRWVTTTGIVECRDAIAAARPTGPQAAAWTTLADAIVADVASDSLHPSGRWQRAPDDQRIDAALLLPAIRGAVRAHDPRSQATLDAVEAELGGSGYVYRFRHDERPLEEAEGAFVLCGFLMALATHQQGRTSDAVGWFERNRSACGPPGLFTEEYDVLQRQLRGSLPQAFVHALMLEAATRLARPWDDQ